MAILVLFIDKIISIEFDIKTIIKYTMIFAIVICIIINLRDILIFMDITAKQYNIKSYALSAFIRTIDGQTNGLSNRNVIWEAAIDFFKNRPVFGSGTAAFEFYYENYTHNIILEILTSYGTFGLLLFFIILINIFKNIIDEKQYEKKLYALAFLVIGIGSLFLSIFMFRWPYFWIALMSTFKEKEDIKESEN